MLYLVVAFILLKDYFFLKTITSLVFLRQNLTKIKNQVFAKTNVFSFVTYRFLIVEVKVPMLRGESTFANLPISVYTAVHEIISISASLFAPLLSLSVFWHLQG